MNIIILKLHLIRLLSGLEMSSAPSPTVSSSENKSGHGGFVVFTAIEVHLAAISSFFFFLR